MFEIEKLGTYATRTRRNTVINVISDPKEPDIQADGSITATLDFSSGEKKQVQSPVKLHETIYSDNESNAKTNDNVYSDIADIDDTDYEDTDRDIVTEDTENTEIQADNKKPSSNFGNARIF